MAIFDYTGKVVLLTGIGSVGDGYGNGTAMAAVMARQGAIVFGCDINLEAANRARDAINSEDQVKRPAVEVFQTSTVCPAIIPYSWRLIDQCFQGRNTKVRMFRFRPSMSPKLRPHRCPSQQRRQIRARWSSRAL